MTQPFEGKVALVTGAAAGIGEATARAFADAGASVMLSDINQEAGEQVAAAINEAGGKAAFIRCDVIKAGDVKHLVDQTVEQFGRLDFAFNNAGVELERNKLADGNEDVFDAIMDVNVKGVWQCMRHEIPVMVDAGSGVIVNTASVAGLGAAPAMSIYSASKHAVVGLTKSAAVEYGRRGVRVNAVCPAIIDTDMLRRAIEEDPRKEEVHKNMHPIGRIGQPQEVAAAVLYLCSEGAGFTTGVALPLDGGYTAI
ncbi:SDR family oxidoreductase [Marinobacter zhanjiangensis]|uniref:Short chain dehydrogenase n=1 Tax=Marinobacter zhanjiangensis TaxID=578215 RepID=A0ABQ3B3L9_9GAMM|nr:SDR family oxidoreductase [Marinobacter zhanjiangensis]GGY72640.1 short chain dehydrogenase [Marinobacter zhanjiangensis]